MSHIVLNEDSTHYFIYHPTEEMTPEGLDAWVDQYAGTQVRDLTLNLNCQRSSVAAKAKQTAWDGFDPNADNEQPFFAGVRDQPWRFSPDGQRAHMRRWVYHSWLLDQKGLDPYARWIARCRARGIRPWISMRMNDVHFVDQPEHCIHDRFWKTHPEFRRDIADGYNGQCLDYARPEVRAYQAAYAQEMIARYDIDGFELDWMRNPYYFKPGREDEGRAVLTEFVAEIRGMLDRRGVELRRRLELAVRVPSRPTAALPAGMDAAEWARRKLIDRLVVTPFLFVEFDMPIETWKQMLEGTDVVLVAGLYPSLLPYDGGERGSVNLETARGSAIAQLDRGADMIYLFNYMDHTSTPESRAAYQTALREMGAIRTMTGKSRRHVLTSPDFRPPGEPRVSALSCVLTPGNSAEFRIPIGPPPSNNQIAQLRLDLSDRETDASLALDARVNGESCKSAARIAPPPGWTLPTWAFEIPPRLLRRGYNVIETRNVSSGPVKLTWLELAVSETGGQWPDGLHTCQMYPF